MGDFVRGKKPKETTLFDHPSKLRTSFDLYLAEGPARITADVVKGWATLFPTDSASIVP